MIEMTEKDDAVPLCPHCTAPIEEIWFRALRALLGKRYVYFCAKCLKVLGVSHRKGFWMG